MNPNKPAYRTVVWHILWR